MSGDVVQFRPKGITPPREICYERVPTDVLCSLFEELRGANNDDYLLILNTSADEGRVIQSGYLGGRGLDEEVYENLSNLYDLVDDNAPEPDELDTYAVCFGDNGDNAVFLRGERDVIGCAYHDSEDCPKGMMMASLIAYSFALINADSDETLAQNAFSYLPFETAIGLSQYFYTKAEEIVFDEAGEF